MASTNRISNYQFHVSEETFKSIVLAIAVQSIENKKVENISSIVIQAITNDLMPSAADIDYVQKNKSDGDCRITMRIKGEFVDAFENYRRRLSALAGSNCAARETALAICHTLSKKITVLPNPPTKS